MRLPNEQEQEALRNMSVAARRFATAMIPRMKRMSEALTQFGKAYRHLGALSESKTQRTKVG